jgi:hypothetical protein
VHDNIYGSFFEQPRKRWADLVGRREIDDEIGTLGTIEADDIDSQGTELRSNGTTHASHGSSNECSLTFELRLHLDIPRASTT